MEQISLLHVLVVGLRGVGAETAKCLAQSGVQRLTLLDDELVRQEDFSVNCLLCDSDIGKPKAKVMASRLNELSPFADIRVMQGTLTLELMLNFHVIVYANPNITMEELVAYDEFCRAQAPPIGFILAEQFGLVGRVFVDFSPAHWNLDTATESEVELRVLTKQTQCSDETATIVVKEPLVLRMFRAGDAVVLRKTNEPSDERLGSDAAARFKVEEVINDCTLCISHTGTARAQERITNAAHLRKLQVEASTTHYSLRGRLLNPGQCANPFRNDTGRSCEAHMAIMGIHAFRRELGFHPASNNFEHTERVVEIIKDLVELNKRVATETKQPVMTTTDCDFSVIARLLRCASTELLPVCAIVAGYAVLQVFAFTGALGRPLGDSRSQFMEFDILDQVPSWDARPEFRSSSGNWSRQSTLEKIFGTEAARLLTDARFMCAGLGSIGCEVLKNLRCLGVGANGNSHVTLSTLDSPAVEADELAAQVLFPPDIVGLNKLKHLQSLFPNWSFSDGSLHCLRSSSSLCAGYNAVFGNVAELSDLIFLDEYCRDDEIPSVLAWTDARSTTRLFSVLPHQFATIAERFLPEDIRDNPLVHAFDYIPRPFSVLDNTPVVDTDQTVQSTLHAFKLLFSSAIEIANKYFAATRLKSNSDDTHISDCSTTLTVWLTWTVALRGRDARDFSSCVQVAWPLVELLPTIMNDQYHSNPDKQVQLIEVRQENADFLQLLVATACIVANSLSITIPSLENRRQTVAELLASGAASALSLFRQPRTSDSIRESFASATATPESLSQLLEITKRVRAIPLDLSDDSAGHLHFVQALLNLQFSWVGAPRIVDMPQLRRYLHCPRDIPPHASILGGIATLELVSHVVRASFDTVSPQDYIWDPTQQRLCVKAPPSPLQTRALPFEQTRGGPLVVPFPGNGAGFSRWMKLRIPLSRDLQSAAAIAAYLETRFAITVHAIVHPLTGLRVEITRQLKDPERSVFELVGCSSTVLLLDVEAVDSRAQGADVSLPPIRVERWLQDRS